MRNSFFFCTYITSVGIDEEGEGEWEKYSSIHKILLFNVDINFNMF